MKLTILEALIKKARQPEHWTKFNKEQIDYIIKCEKEKKINEQAFVKIYKIVGGLKRWEM
jgi:hypothetical protein